MHFYVETDVLVLILSVQRFEMFNIYENVVNFV